jgi:Fic family protein
VIYESPALSDADRAVLNEIERLREQLRFVLVRPRRWYGTLRRVTVARAIQGSNSIEGYHASVEDVAAIVEGEGASDVASETRHAIEGYRDALTYVLQLASRSPGLDVAHVQALHFMMMKHDHGKNPGDWRPGAIWIENAAGDVVYEAPDREILEGLVGELLEWLKQDRSPVFVRAAMAHLNLTLIHPFSDGNGRMARCLQTYVLAAGGLDSPVFASVEEYLGDHTSRYYEVLAEVAQGRWSPERSTRAWLQFSLTAHYQQAQALLRRVAETEALWDRCEQLARNHALPPRCVAPLCDAARGWRLSRSLYVKTVRSALGEEVKDQVATRDLRALVDEGLFDAVGEKRGRRYEASAALREVLREIRAEQAPLTAVDPYTLVR